MNFSRKLIASIALTAAGLASAAAATPASGYDQGVTATTITVGRTSSFTGILSRNAEASEAGIRAVWADVNSHGGVRGRAILQKSLDDAYDVEKAKAAARALVNEDKVFALIFSNGTAQSNAILPIITAAKVPLIGSSSGSVMRKKGQETRYFFNTRNDNGDDVGLITGHLKEIRDPKICVVYQDDNYGKTMLAEMESAAERDHVQIVGKAAMAPAAKSAADAIKDLSSAGCSRVGNVAMLLLDKPTGVFLRDYKAAKLNQRLFGTTSSGEFEREAGPDAAANVIVAQTTPPMSSFDTPALVEFRKLMMKDPKTVQYANSVLAFEGYMAAKIFVTALDEAGANPTREGVVSALEKFKGRNMGGLFFDYSTPAHEGMHYAELFMWSTKGSMIY